MLFIAFYIVLSFVEVTGQDCRGRMDIGFVLDGSGSVSLPNWRHMLSFVKEFAGRVRYGPSDTRIGVISYGDEATLDISLLAVPSLKEFRKAVDKIYYLNQGTNTAAGIRVLREQLFTAQNGDRAGVVNVGLVVTDGESNVDKEKTIPEAKAARKEGIVLFALGVGDNLNQRELKALGYDPDNNYVFNVGDFNMLLRNVDEIANSACGVVNRLGNMCNFDIAFILDSSGSIGQSNWEKVKEFSVNFVSRLTIGRNDTQVGVVSFSTKSEMVIPFNRYQSLTNLQSAILKLEWKDHLTHTAAGLVEARLSLFTMSSGDRPDAENVAVVLTDSRTNVNQSRIVIEANNLRETRKVRIFSIAIGDDLRMSDMREMASDPDYYHFIIMRDYNQLVARSYFIYDSVCANTRPAARLDYTACRADIAFVLDESGSVGRPNWDRMLQFVSEFASQMNIGPNANRVGVVKFGSFSTLAIRLDEFDNSQDFARAVMGLSYNMGGTNTAAGLRATRELFSSANGDRSEISNMAIVLTDGASINKNQTIAQANTTRNAGITLFAIGIGNALARSELQGIANDPDGDYLFYSSDFEALVNDSGKILRYTCFVAASFIPVWSCDFDLNTTTATWCGIQQLTEDQFDWTIHSGPTPSRFTGPASANTGSFYIYSETSAPRKKGDEAEFILPYSAEKEGAFCLTFYKHMHGFHIGALQVFTRRIGVGDLTIWSLKGPQGNMWSQQYVDIHLIRHDKIGVRSIRWRGYSGDIAIDTMKLIRGACPPTPIT